MYSSTDLEKYSYFKDADVNFILDSLTGVISRQYILDFAKHLCDENKPFTMCMLDLDNFKYINDNYGHKAGDVCLKTIAESLQNCVGNDGLVGRFGGDEFIIIYQKSTDYDDVHDFLANLYTEEGAVRKFVFLDNIRVFVTATIGCASFPKDAGNYDELFLKMDKALYRGKIKGRNCYIIYVHEKHKDIVVRERGGNSLLSKLQDVEKIVENEEGNVLITHIVDYIYRVLHPFNAVFIDKKNYVQSGNDTRNYLFGNNAYFMLDKILGSLDILSCSDPGEFVKKYPDTAYYIVPNRIHAFVIARVPNYGFFIILENSVTRMWQDYDLVLCYFSAMQLTYKLNGCKGK